MHKSTAAALIAHSHDCAASPAVAAEPSCAATRPFARASSGMTMIAPTNTARPGQLVSGCDPTEPTDRSGRHVQRKDPETDGDELLSATLGCARAAVTTCIEPQNRARGDKLDQRVQAERKQRDRPRDYGGGDRDTGLHSHPPDTQQRKRPRAADQQRASLAGWLENGQRKGVRTHACTLPSFYRGFCARTIAEAACSWTR